MQQMYSPIAEVYSEKERTLSCDTWHGGHPVIQLTLKEKSLNAFDGKGRLIAGV